MIKKIPWWLPEMTGRELALIKGVIESNYINEGDLTEQFEQEVARLLGARHAVAVTSGTVALFLSLAGLGVGPNDEVIVPDATFIATANAVKLAGAKPILVDIDPLTLNIDPDAVRSAITARTKAVIPVHVSGRAANMDMIHDVAETHGLFVIEDAAEALMSAVNGKFLGTFGHAGCLSFSPNKAITTGQGGMVLTNDSILHSRLLEMKDQGRPVRGTGGDDVHYSVGYNFKLTNLQAAVGLGQLPALPSRIKRQKEIYNLYADNLCGLDGVALPGFRTVIGEAPLWTDAIIERRDDLDTYLRARGVECRRFWLPVHTQKPYLSADGAFPCSTRILPHALWLPSAFTLSDADVLTVCSYIHEFVRS